VEEWIPDWYEERGGQNSSKDRLRAQGGTGRVSIGECSLLQGKGGIDYLTSKEQRAKSKEQRAKSKGGNRGLAAHLPVRQSKWKADGGTPRGVLPAFLLLGGRRVHVRQASLLKRRTTGRRGRIDDRESRSHLHRDFTALARKDRRIPPFRYGYATLPSNIRGSHPLPFRTAQKRLI
jgi:hypothetical protein